jgi:hypothetical protein
MNTKELLSNIYREYYSSENYIKRSELKVISGEQYEGCMGRKKSA